MTGHTQFAVTPRDRFLEAARKELVAFERRERENFEEGTSGACCNCSYRLAKTNFTIKRGPVTELSNIKRSLDRPSPEMDIRGKLRPPFGAPFSLISTPPGDVGRPAESSHCAMGITSRWRCQLN